MSNKNFLKILTVSTQASLPTNVKDGTIGYAADTTRHYMCVSGVWYQIPNSTELATVDGKIGCYVGTTFVVGAYPFSAKVTTDASGNAVVALTNGVSGPAFSQVYTDTINTSPYNTTSNLQPGSRTLSVDKKTLTIAIKQPLLSLGILSLTTAASGSDVVVTLIVKP